MGTRSTFSITCLLIGTLVVSTCLGVSLTTKDLIDIENELPVLEYEDSPEFLELLRTQSFPVLLRGTPAQTRWAAMTAWAPQGNNPSSFYLSRISERSVGVKRNTAPKFPIGCCPLHPMTQKEFWNAMSVLPEGEYMYLNADISILDPALRSDVHPPFFSTSLARESGKKTITNVWMGSTGSTAGLHHDPFDNFFVQLFGRKRFYLFPPELQHALYVYPKTHPASRQSQVNINDPDTTKFPRLAMFAEQSGLEVIVKPGDVLYLPPFWFHQVEALETAISVNTWLTSPVVAEMDEAWSEPLPFGDDWSDEGFILGTKELITHLVHKVLGESTDTPEEKQRLVKHFMKDLVATRFTPLYGETASVYSDLMADIKSADDPHLRVHIREQAEIDASTLVSADSIAHLPSICAIPVSELYEADEDFAQRLKVSVAAIARHFLTVERNSGLQLIQLNDFVEDLVGQVVGDKSVHHYLKSCFVQRDMFILPIEDGQSI